MKQSTWISKFIKAESIILQRGFRSQHSYDHGR